jgi:hypothetical protein
MEEKKDKYVYRDVLLELGQSLVKVLPEDYNVLRCFERHWLYTLEVEKVRRFLVFFRLKELAYRFEPHAFTVDGVLGSYEGGLEESERRKIENLLKKAAEEANVKIMNKGLRGLDLLLPL